MTVALDHPVYSTVYNVRSLKRFYARNVHFVGTTDNRENSKKPVEKKTCKKVHSCQFLCSLRYILGPEVKRADCCARKILNSDSSEVIIDKVFDASVKLLKHLNTSNARTPVHKNLKQSESIYQRHDKLKVWKDTLFTKPIHLFHPI